MNGNISTSDLLLAKLNRVSDLLKLIRHVKNWYSVILFSSDSKKTLVIRLRSGKNVRVNDLSKFWNSRDWQEEAYETNKNLELGKSIVKVRYKNKKLKFVEAAETDIVLQEQFLKDQYIWLRPKNKIVIDIGANIGDSAMYFAVNGAKHVFAFEPYPSTHVLAKRNIKLNNLGNKITLVNAGYGKSRTLTIDTNYLSSAGSDLKNFKTGIKVPIYNLKQIFEKFKIEKAALKMDCEGSEYQLLDTNDELLRRFDSMMIEYHYGYQNLVKKLKGAGFEVEYTRPRYAYNTYSENPHMYSGLIKARLKK